MAVTVEIKTGAQQVIAYILSPAAPLQHDSLLAQPKLNSLCVDGL